METDVLEVENEIMDNNKTETVKKSRATKENNIIKMDPEYTDPGLIAFNDSQFNTFDTSTNLSITNVHTNETIQAPILSAKDFLKYNPNKLFYRVPIPIYFLKTRVRSYDLMKYTPETIPFEPSFYILFNSDVSDKSTRHNKQKVSIKDMFKKDNTSTISNEFKVLNKSIKTEKALKINSKAFDDFTMKSIINEIRTNGDESSPVRYYESLYLPRIMRRSSARTLLSNLLNVMSDQTVIYYHQNEELFNETRSVLEPYITIGDVSNIFIFIQPEYKPNEFLFKEIEKEITTETKLIAEIYNSITIPTKIQLHEASVVLKHQSVMYNKYTSELFKEWVNSGLPYDSSTIIDMYGGDNTNDTNMDDEDDYVQEESLHETESVHKSPENIYKRRKPDVYMRKINKIPTQTPGTQIHLLNNYTFGHIKDYNARYEHMKIYKTQTAYDTPVFDIIRFLHFDYSNKNVIKVECQADFPNHPADTCIIRSFKKLNEKQALHNVMVNKKSVSLHMFDDIGLTINGEKIRLCKIIIYESGDVEFLFNFSTKYTFTPLVLTSLVSYMQNYYKIYFKKYFIDSAVSSFIFDINNYKAFLNTFSVFTEINKGVDENTIKTFNILSEQYPYTQIYSTLTTTRFGLFSYSSCSNISAAYKCIVKTDNNSNELINKSINPTIYIRTTNILEACYSGLHSMYDLYINMLVVQYISQLSGSIDNNVKIINEENYSNQLEYLRAKYSDVGKKTIKTLQQADPVLFDTVKVNNQQIPYSSIVSRSYQRPYIVTNSEYEYLNTVVPNSVTRIQNQTYPEQSMNLFCAFEEYGTINFKNINGRCIPFCSSKFINSNVFNNCMISLNGSTEERDTSRTLSNLSVYNPNADYSTITDIPQELIDIIPNVYAYRPFLTDVNKIVQYCDDMYGLYPVIIYREVSETDNTISYKLLTTRTADKYTVLTMIDSEAPDRVSIFVNQRSIYNKNIATKPNEIIFNKKVYAPCVSEENIMLRDLVDNAWGLNAEIFAFYNTLKWLLKSIDPTFRYNNSEINKNCLFIVKNNIVIGVIYKMYFVPTLHVKYSIDFVNCIHRTKRIINEIEYRLGVLPLYMIEHTAFEQNKSMQSWSEDGMVKLIPLSVLNTKYINEYYLDFTTKEVIGVSFNKVFVPVKPEIPQKPLEKAVYVDKYTITLNFTGNLLNRDLLEKHKKILNKITRLIDEIIYLCVKNHRFRTDITKTNIVYEYTDKKIYDIMRYVVGFNNKTSIVSAGRSNYINVFESAVEEKEFLKHLFEHKNDYTNHMNIIHVNRYLNKLYKIESEEIPNSYVYKKKVYNYDSFM